MRNSALALTALLVLSTAACGSDSTGPNGGDGGTVTATIAGANFSGSLATAATYQGGILAFAGTESNQGGTAHQLNVTLNGVNGTGTYNVGPGQFSIVVYTEAEGTNAKVWTSTLLGGTGSVTVTELTDSRAKGTFSFTLQPSENTGATGTKSITNGSFDVKLSN